MLSAGAYSFRHQSRLALYLSWIGGYVNVVAILATTHSVSHTTGNTTLFAEYLAKAQWTGALVIALILLCFLIGAILSAVMTEGAIRHRSASRYILPISAEAILLLVLASIFLLQRQAGWSHASVTIAIVCLGSITMGLQNATITHISGSVVRTTHLTGVFTDLGIEIVKLFLWWKTRARLLSLDRSTRLFRVFRRHIAFERIILFSSIIGSFGFGALAGALAYMRWPDWTLFAPVIFLLWIIYTDWRRPTASVQMLDPLSDVDLQNAGIIPELLPIEVGLYRLNFQAGKRYRAPDFQLWAQTLPEKWTAVVLVFSSTTSLDANAAMDLQLATKSLIYAGKQLILAGLTHKQIHLLKKAGMGSLLVKEHLCSDITMAVSQAVQLVNAQAKANAQDVDAEADSDTKADNPNSNQSL